MSSLPRRIQTRAFKRQSKNRLPVISDEGFLVGRKWPTAKGQLFFGQSGAVFTADSKHPTLQPLIDVLAEQAARSSA